MEAGLHRERAVRERQISTQKTAKGKAESSRSKTERLYGGAD
jgi:hypothetical protein